MVMMYNLLTKVTNMNYGGNGDVLAGSKRERLCVCVREREREGGD